MDFLTLNDDEEKELYGCRGSIGKRPSGARRPKRTSPAA
jgi:hypothetical protein